MNRDAVERLTGAAVTGARPVTRGYTNAVRCLAELDDGRTVFVKQAVDEETRRWLRAEQTAYTTIDGSFMPAVVASGDGTLILEDLTGAHWPPPWSDADLRAVRDALELHAITPPPGLPHPEVQEDLRGGWRTVAEDPEPFLSLGLVTPDWLEANLAALRHAGEHARVDGDSVVHMDIRSDNLCVAGGRCRIVDWNWVCCGNPDLDLAFWMPSLRLEGGSEPAGHAELAAMFAGFLACRAGLPEPAAGVRAIQRAQLDVALPWAVRELGLSRPRPR